MKDNTQYDYSNYDLEDDIIDRGDMTWQEDAGYGDLHEVELPDDIIEYVKNIWEAKYHNDYYLGNNQYGYRQITMSNQEYLLLNPIDND